MSRLIKMTGLLLTLYTLVATSLYAQLSYGEPMRKHRGPEHLIEILELSDAQAVQFKTIMGQQHQKRMNTHQQYRDSRQKERQALKALHKETVEKLTKVLTTDQLNLFEQETKKHRRPR